MKFTNLLLKNDHLRKKLEYTQFKKIAKFVMF